MCGIFGYIGARQASPLILDGLSRLEYRGYDSAGAVTLDANGYLQIRKTEGKVIDLSKLIDARPLSGNSGLGHTRWATHGKAINENAHPHTDASGTIAVVHNGIVENYADLSSMLQNYGYSFTSSTDSEVIPNLISHHMAEGRDFLEAVRTAAGQLNGAHAIAAIWNGNPDTLVAVRIGNAGGISIGYAKAEMFLASDITALAPVSDKVAALAADQIAIVTPEGCTYQSLDGKQMEGIVISTPTAKLVAEKNGHPHFMLKEIMEQPETVTQTLEGRLTTDPSVMPLPEIPFSMKELNHIQRVVLVGMGSSLHASQVGAQLIERVARIPSTAENASEFRYRDPLLNSTTLVVAVGQSGETVDTLQALDLANNKGARTLTICNIEGSEASRLAEGTILMHSGPEVAVASSKTFTSSLLCLYLLAVSLGQKRGTLNDEDRASHLDKISQLPRLLGDTLKLNENSWDKLAERYSKFSQFLFIGRGLLEPIAREGALKLKEISYIHAEGLPAGELKHGPIALINPECPVVTLAPQDHLYSKMLNSVNEIKARNGHIIPVATEGDQIITDYAEDVIWIPHCPAELLPIVIAIPLQLFAYNMALNIGTDIDQPRNLAKSVTVE